MRKRFTIILCLLICLCTLGCNNRERAQIVATTLPVYDLTYQLCQGTDISVQRLITESVSCLHDYTLQVSQMRLIESAELIVISGGGLEDFLTDALRYNQAIADASVGIALTCGDHHHHEDSHNHDQDPHFWLSTANGKQMAQNICTALITAYPHQESIFQENLTKVLEKFEDVESYASEKLQNLSARNIITFHDGFHYMAQAWDLKILHTVEEESGSEASAAELIELVGIVKDHRLPAIFTEINGSCSAAQIISNETGAKIFSLDMAMSGESYFDALYYNIDTLKEALE